LAESTAGHVVLNGEGGEVMRRIALILGVILIVVGALGVLDALGLVTVSICGLFWAAVWIGLGVWIVWGALRREPSTELEEASIPLEGATSARVSISHGAGRLQVGGGAEPGALVQGTFAGGLIHDVSRQGEVLNVKMRVRGEGMLMVLLPWKWARFRGAGWIMRMNEAVPLTLKIEGGASENLLDLTDLQVRELEIETGDETDSASQGGSHQGQRRLRRGSGGRAGAIRRGGSCTGPEYPGGGEGRPETFPDGKRRGLRVAGLRDSGQQGGSGRGC
jgi:hypothetical protein